MKAVQDWLREADVDGVIGEILAEYPIDWAMLEEKDRTVHEVITAVKENLRSLVRYLLSLEAIRTDDMFFYAVHIRKELFPAILAVLSNREDILEQELPDSYSWEFIDWERIMGYPIAETKLTMDRLNTVLAQILYEMTFFGVKHEDWRKRKAEVEESLRRSAEEVNRGECYSAEEVFAQFNLPEDEPDPVADDLNRQINLAKMEYDQHCLKHESEKVRELLNRSDQP